jgi:hypothetical protein
MNMQMQAKNKTTSARGLVIAAAALVLGTVYQMPKALEAARQAQAAVLQQQKWVEELKAILQLADRGNAEAQAQAGLRLLNRSFSRTYKPRQGYELLEKAAAQEVGSAQYALAHIVLIGLPTEKGIDKGVVDKARGAELMRQSSRAACTYQNSYDVPSEVARKIYSGAWPLPVDRKLEGAWSVLSAQRCGKSANHLIDGSARSAAETAALLLVWDDEAEKKDTTQQFTREDWEQAKALLAQYKVAAQELDRQYPKR